MDALHLIITIDGPSGSGKSTLARGVASRLDFRYLDTGAIYRAATLAAMRAGVSFTGEPDPAAILRAVKACKLDMQHPNGQPMRVLLDGDDVTKEIRTEHVTMNIRWVADLREVRAEATAMQRRIAVDGRYVCEGRDQGTVVFPNAFLKIYLWADPEARAHRRAEELRSVGEDVDIPTLIRRMRDRDRLDMSREVGALKKALDAVEIDSSNLTIAQGIDKVAQLARERLATLNVA